MDGLVTCRCGCGLAPKNARSQYASDRCRARASQRRRAPIPATVRTVRTLKDGTQQVIVHVKPLWAVRAARGDEINLGRRRAWSRCASPLPPLSDPLTLTAAAEAVLSAPAGTPVEPQRRARAGLELARVAAGCNEG